jgi:hypothetical protein
MKTATINELQKELTLQPPEQLLRLCLRLAKHKNENKELLTYLLFEAGDEETFRIHIKEEISRQFGEMNSANLYLAKKTIRKVLRTMNKYIRFSGSKETEIDLRVYYCTVLRDSGIPFRKSQVLVNLYDGQIKKINAAVSKLHEDLQFDYRDTVESLL